jgi:hypothetical protein
MELLKFFHTNLRKKMEESDEGRSRGYIGP